MNLPKQFDITSLAYGGKEPCIYWGERGFGIRVYPGGSIEPDSCLGDALMAAMGFFQH